MSTAPAQNMKASGMAASEPLMQTQDPSLDTAFEGLEVILCQGNVARWVWVKHIPCVFIQDAKLHGIL